AAPRTPPVRPMRNDQSSEDEFSATLAPTISFHSIPPAVRKRFAAIVPGIEQHAVPIGAPRTVVVSRNELR
ncbi:MAG: hypothetical protein WAU74_14750, partial [Pseudolabrys sp.]